MKRKIYKVFIIILFTIIFIIGGLVIFYKENGKIFSFKNIKQAINEENNITTIDVTGLVTGAEIEHEHILKSQYDDNTHWQECIICNQKQNIENHTLKTTWANTKLAQCYRTNFYTSTCTCGYSKTAHKPCTWDGNSYIQTLVSDGSYTHVRKCSVCKEHIQWSYYLNGQLFEIEQNQYMTGHEEPCYKSDGTQLTCDNLGTCYICKQARNVRKHFLRMDLYNGKIYCRTCKQEYGTISQEITKDTNNAPTTYTIITTLNLTNGVTFDKVGYIRGDSTTFSSRNQQITSIDSTRTQVILTGTAKFNSSWKGEYEIYVRENFKIGGTSTIGDSTWVKIYPDPIPPEITNISIGIAAEKWTKSKTITITGTENYCNTVSVEILDDQRKTIYKGSGTVTNKNYSIECTPELEAGIEGRKFKLIVTDACENRKEQEFTISKIDGIPPTPTSENEILGEWAKTKEFTFTAEDKGIGNIQIAFNTTEDYQSALLEGDTYSRKYRFIGDVYKKTNATIYYKDELNNVSVQKITIDKIDNTAPTITGASFSNNKLNIVANDRHQTEGEGSGITKYRFMTSSSKLKNPEFTQAGSTEVNVNDTIIMPEIYKVKYVYIVAEDAVRKRKSNLRSRSATIRINKQSKCKRRKWKRNNRIRLVRI